MLKSTSVKVKNSKSQERNDQIHVGTTRLDFIETLQAHPVPARQKIVALILMSPSDLSVHLLRTLPSKKEKMVKIITMLKTRTIIIMRV